MDGTALGHRHFLGSVGEPTLMAECEQAQKRRLDGFCQGPARRVVALMEAFPGATITDVRDLAQAAPASDDGASDDAGDLTYPADNGDLTLDIGDEL